VLLTIHTMGMTVFAGLVAMMDLRMAGIGNLRTPLTEIQKKLFPWQTIAMLVCLATGLPLIYGQPTRYYLNLFFWIKMVTMAVAMLNALIFHQTVYHSVSSWDSDPSRIPPAAKRAAVLSLVLWAIVVITGRLMAYSWFNWQRSI
jgi:type IV secretory pathway VirB2 component (pilin)